MQTKTKTNTKTLLTIKIDKKLKLAAQKTAEHFGLPLGTYINSHLKDFVRRREIRLGGESYTPNAETIRAIEQSEKEYARGEFEGPFTIEQLRKHWKLN